MFLDSSTPWSYSSQYSYKGWKSIFPNFFFIFELSSCLRHFTRQSNGSPLLGMQVTDASKGKCQVNVPSYVQKKEVRKIRLSHFLKVLIQFRIWHSCISNHLNFGRYGFGLIKIKRNYNYFSMSPIVHALFWILGLIPGWIQLPLFWMTCFLYRPYPHVTFFAQQQCRVMKEELGLLLILILTLVLLVEPVLTEKKWNVLINEVLFEQKLKVGLEDRIREA